MTKKFSTICQHLGEEKGAFCDSVVPPLFETVNFYFKNFREAADYFAGSKTGRYYYTRVLNPTTEVLEKKLAALEGGEACKCFASGMGAIGAAIMGTARAGDHVVCVAAVYKNTHRILTEIAPRYNISTTFISGKSIDEFERAIRPETRIIYLESPSSSKYSLQDLGAVAGLAKSKGIITMIDNTCATPFNQNPLAFGIDLVIHSGSKYLNGHGDVLMGAVIGSKDLVGGIAGKEHYLMGNILPPFESWLVLRGLRSFPVRMEHFNRVGLEIAEFLEEHPAVARVYYPMLASHPQHHLALRQMRGAGSLLAVELKGGPAKAARFIDSLRYFKIAASWGGYESLVWYPMIAKPDAGPEYMDLHDVNPSMVRIFIGMEDIEDIKEDLDQALRKD
ncbi:MAG: aminotransferase class I/II-fold pyridoxal phosphate-dependent enzyme [Peptococcaceae bacterium]|nr:aminotransferase class I/II-fold pyridoxal phosphate-dependent enzyme [Peptococcaceae bacterium]